MAPLATNDRRCPRGPRYPIPKRAITGAWSDPVAPRAEQDLGGGGQRFVVEVAEHDHGALLALVVQQPSRVVAQGDGLGGAQRERVAGVARARSPSSRGLKRFPG